MKIKLPLSVGFLTVALCIPTAHAIFYPHNHQQKAFPSHILISAWAQNLIEDSMALGLGPRPFEYEVLPEQLSEPISRSTFCDYAANLIAVQQNCDTDNLTNMVIHYHTENDNGGNPIQVFLDTNSDSTAVALYYLGVVEGRGDGSFDPDANITRQEAAAFLVRTYKSYGGTLPDIANVTDFKDDEEIASWAKEDVAAMSVMGIMQGDELGNFLPTGLYSYEQCLATLVRMYDTLPISRKQGNINPLYTYSQYITYIEELNQRGETIKLQQIEGALATFVETRTVGTMHGATLCNFIYKDGGFKTVQDMGVCNTGNGALNGRIQVDSPYFFEDGGTFFCSITLDESVEDYSNGNPDSILHGHEAGTYQITIDVKSCIVQARRQGDGSLETRGRFFCPVGQHPLSAEKHA